MKLTDVTIRNLKIPAKGAVVYYDGQLTGFGVRISEGGTKSFILTHGPRRRRETTPRILIRHYLTGSAIMANLECPTDACL